jgi:hypothetical protein
MTNERTNDLNNQNQKSNMGQRKPTENREERKDFSRQGQKHGQSKDQRTEKDRSDSQRNRQ